MGSKQNVYFHLSEHDLYFLADMKETFIGVNWTVQSYREMYGECQFLSVSTCGN